MTAALYHSTRSSSLEAILYKRVNGTAVKLCCFSYDTSNVSKEGDVNLYWFTNNQGWYIASQSVDFNIE